MKSKSNKQGQPENKASAFANNTAVKFHNPYGFIPALARKHLPCDHALADRYPIGHSRYFAGHWSGEIQVNMRIKSPLLILAAETTQGNVATKSRHNRYSTQRLPDGSPYIPASSIKGMLRAAYEAITNSRMGVFKGHARRLSYRMDLNHGNIMVPARINGDYIELLPGNSIITPDRGFSQGKPAVLFSAWLPSYCRNPVVFDNGDKAVSGEKVVAELALYQHWISRRNKTSFVNNFNFWRVERLYKLNQQPDGITKRESVPTAVPEQSDRDRFERFMCPIPEQENILVKGYVYITNQNMANKHDERVFFISEQHPQKQQCQILLSQEIKDAWQELIYEYWRVHKKQEIWRTKSYNNSSKVNYHRPEDFLGSKPGEPAWAPHIYQNGKLRMDDKTMVLPDASKLKDQLLCYAKVKQRSCGKFDVLGLYPVPISRELYSKSPEDLLFDSVQPACSLAQLSPADRVFGWCDDKQRLGYLGQLRIHSIRCQQTGTKAIQTLGKNARGIVLTALDLPKPQQSRFYVGDYNNNQNLVRPQKDGIDRKQAGYMTGKVLRGRKVYPHQQLPKKVEFNYWNPKKLQTETAAVEQLQENFFREYLSLSRTASDYKPTVLDWIKPTSRFAFKIQVVNLTAVELGALLWLLNLSEGHYFRLGAGKPLGFGSISLNVDWDRSHLKQGQDWQSYYSQFFTEKAHDNCRTNIKSILACIKQYQEAVESAYKNKFEQVQFIQAFLRMAKGFDDKLPTHYPRTSPFRQTNLYKWFVENEKIFKNKKLSALALGDLVDDSGQADSGLPYYIGRYKK